MDGWMDGVYFVIKKSLAFLTPFLIRKFIVIEFHIERVRVPSKQHPDHYCTLDFFFILLILEIMSYRIHVKC